MDFFEIVRRRHSTRSFKADPVEPEKLETILEAANAAPSAGNQQAYEIFRIQSPEKKAALARGCYSQQYVAQAPEVLVFCGHGVMSAQKYGARGEQLYAIQDATIACAYAMLAASAQGLGCVWVGAFKDQAIWETLGSPQGMKPVAVLPIGYPDEPPLATSRRPLTSIVHEV
jgi:nitroreductase